MSACVLFFFGNKNTPNTDDEGRSSTGNRPKENRRRRNANFWVKNKCLMQQKHLVSTNNIIYIMVQWKNGLYLQDERFLYTRTILIRFSHSTMIMGRVPSWKLTTCKTSIYEWGNIINPNYHIYIYIPTGNFCHQLVGQADHDTWSPFVRLRIKELPGRCEWGG